MATVISIHRIAQRDAPAEALSAATFVADLGLDGDWRSRRGKGRQITLIEAEALDDVASVLGVDGIPPGASRRQIVIRGMSLNGTVGRRLRIGPLLVAIEELCDPCVNMERKIGLGAQDALAGRGGVCGRVIEGGVVRPGDAVTPAEQPPGGPSVAGGPWRDPPG